MTHVEVFGVDFIVFGKIKIFLGDENTFCQIC